MAPPQLGSVLRQLHKITGPEPTDAQLLQRFAAQQDEAAFSALLRRHGRLVWSVCRRVLRHEQDAEDAFQATFLVLARRAGSIRTGQAVRSWLYQVAHHVAVKATRRETRRHAYERRAASRPRRQPGSEQALQELQEVLEAELDRLPEKYRAPFVLCCLDGHSKSETARVLGWKEGTVSGRLALARQRLRERLSRRGVLLSAVLCAEALSDRSRTALPADLLGRTVHAGARFAADGAAVENLVSAEVADLAHSAARTLFASRLPLAALVLLVAGIALAGVGLLMRQVLATGTDEPRSGAQAPAVEPGARKAPVVPDAREVRGRVLGPDGKPFKGAKLLLPWDTGVRAFASSDDDGLFHFSLRRADIDPAGYDDDPWHWITVIATAQGFGPDWHYLHETDRSGQLTLRLVRDDVPITGRVLDLQGRPVAGVTVRVVRLNAAADEQLDLFLKQWPSQPWDAINGGVRVQVARADGGMVPREVVGTQWRRIWPDTCPALFPAATTDKYGRFHLRGFGRERLVELLIHGPAIEQVDVRVVMRKDIDVQALRKPGAELLRQFGLGDKLPFPMPALYGAHFEHVVGPTKPLLGTVRDHQTGKPLTGIHVVGTPVEFRGLNTDVETVTDANGRYRLVGLPKLTGYRVRVDALEEAVHLPQLKEMEDTEGLKPISVDFALRRGVVVEGRLLDQATGKPVIGSIDYAPLAGNTAVDSQISGGQDQLVRQHRPVGKDGKFRLVVFPGPGVVFGFSSSGEYLRTVVRPEDRKRLGDPLFQLGNHFFLLGRSNAYRVIDLADGSKRVHIDLEFLTGRTVTGRVVGPDGKPLAGAEAHPLCGPAFNGGAEPTFTFAGDGTFTVAHVDPRRRNDFVLFHPGKMLAGRLRLTGDEKQPLTVRLEPTGKVRGRVLDDAGEPLAGAEVRSSWTGADGLQQQGARFDPRHPTITTDRDGRFEMEGLLPAISLDLTVLVAHGKTGPAIYVVHTFEKLTWKPGESKDLGTVTTQARRPE